jgi:hypothetical protein
MWDFFANHARTFWKGTFGGVPVWTGILFITNPNISDFLLVVLRLMYGVALGVFTGFGGLLIKFIWEEHIKKRLPKSKYKEDEKGKNKKGKAA